MINNPQNKITYHTNLIISDLFFDYLKIIQLDGNCCEAFITILHTDKLYTLMPLLKVLEQFIIGCKLDNSIVS